MRCSTGLCQDLGSTFFPSNSKFGWVCSVGWILVIKKDMTSCLHIGEYYTLLKGYDWNLPHLLNVCLQSWGLRRNSRESPDASALCNGKSKGFWSHDSSVLISCGILGNLLTSMLLSYFICKMKTKIPTVLGLFFYVKIR